MSMQMSGRNRLPGNSPHPTLSPLASGDRRSNRSGASLNYFRERSLFFFVDIFFNCSNGLHSRLATRRMAFWNEFSLPLRFFPLRFQLKSQRGPSYHSNIFLISLKKKESSNFFFLVPVLER